MRTRLRPARPEDFPGIRSLIREGGINPLGLHWSRFLVIVSEQGQVIACGQIKPHRDGSRELASIAVRRVERGKGLARMVIEQLLAENRSTLYLTCRRSLGPFYEKFGFRKIGTREMPPYFRFASQFVHFLYRLRISQEPILIMRLTPEQPAHQQGEQQAYAFSRRS